MSFIAIIETRIKRNNGEAMRKSFKGKLSWLNNYKDNGRIWLMWETSKMDIKHMDS